MKGWFKETVNYGGPLLLMTYTLLVVVVVVTIINLVREYL